VRQCKRGSSSELNVCRQVRCRLGFCLLAPELLHSAGPAVVHNVQLHLAAAVLGNGGMLGFLLRVVCYGGHSSRLLHPRYSFAILGLLCSHSAVQSKSWLCGRAMDAHGSWMRLRCTWL
jgi:hypothetical protein